MIHLKLRDKFRVNFKGNILEFEIVKCKFTNELYSQQRQSVLKSQYNDKDIEEQNEYNSSHILTTGETVYLDEKLSVVKVHGDYIDGVEFIN